MPHTVGARDFWMDVMFMVVEVERGPGAGSVVSAGERCGRRRSTTEMTSEPHLSAPSHLVSFRKSSNVFILKARAQSTMRLRTSVGMVSELPISWSRACPYSAMVVFSRQSSRAIHKAQSSGVILLVGIRDLAGRREVLAAGTKNTSKELGLWMSQQRGGIKGLHLSQPCG